MTPDSVVDDAADHDRRLVAEERQRTSISGEVTIRRALAQSVNTVAVRLNQDIGRGRNNRGRASALGSNRSCMTGRRSRSEHRKSRLLEMAGAYTAFSNGGDVVEPHVITRMRTDRRRPCPFRNAPPTNTQEIAEADRIGALNDMMNAVVVYGTGERAALPDQPVAGKTGTTQDFRDAWFIGYTSHLTAGVWVGNDNGKPMNRATGGSLPAEIWNQVMRVAHEG